MPVKKKSGEKRVYQLKVTLKGIRPPIWRRIQVGDDTTLQRFHRILRVVMGWEGGHSHQFIIDRKYYGNPSYGGLGLRVISEKSFTLGQVVPAEKTKFTYEYDPGDGWNHDILIEKILTKEEVPQYPICLDGKRACPPEDCGGPWGYEELLEIVKDPSHPEYEDRMDWLGESFDPEKFDVEYVNKELGGSQR